MSAPTPDDEQAAWKYADYPVGTDQIERRMMHDAFLAGIAWERERAERDVGQVLDVAYGRETLPARSEVDDDRDRERGKK